MLTGEGYDGPHSRRSSLGKIFGDLIERVRFAKTLRWREMDSNHRYPRERSLLLPRSELAFEARVAIPGGLIEEVRFARDSPLEGDGFEPSVPRWGSPRARLE